MIEIAGFAESLSIEDRARLLANKTTGFSYVYFLKRSDGSVFYVGKGSGDRLNGHEREARNGVQSRKCSVIRDEWANGREIIKEKVAFFDNEFDAYRLEMLLIDFFGLENLTNRTRGDANLKSRSWYKSSGHTP